MMISILNLMPDPEIVEGPSRISLSCPIRYGSTIVTKYYVHFFILLLVFSILTFLLKYGLSLFCFKLESIKNDKISHDD